MIKNIDPDKIFTVQEIANLGIPYMSSEFTVRKLIKSGDLKPMVKKRGHRVCYLIKGSSILDYLGE